MKRFVDSEIMLRPWFRNLKPRLKCLWVWLFTRCDMAGVIDLDFDLASFAIGEQVTESDLEAMNGNVVHLHGNEYLVVEYIEFQYGELKEECAPHRGVIKTLTAHGLTTEYIKKLISDNKERVIKGLPNPYVRDKDKDKDKDKDNLEREGKSTTALPPHSHPTTSERVKDKVNEHASFDIFWAAYPRKVAKKDAFKAFLKTKAYAHIDVILPAIKRHCATPDWTKDNGQYIPYPATWLNAERWNDILEPSPADKEAKRLEAERKYIEMKASRDKALEEGRI